MVVVIEAEGSVGILGEGVCHSREIDGVVEGAIPAGGAGLFVGEIGSVRRGGIGGDGALVDDSDRLVGVDPPEVAAADGSGVTADGDPGSDGESLVGGAAADGAEAVGVGSSEDEVTSSVDGLRAPLEGDSSAGEGAAVADADGGVVEGQATADGDGACRDVEVAGERDAGEGAATGGGDEACPVGTNDLHAPKRSASKHNRASRVDLGERRRSGERDRGARPGVADDGCVTRRGNNVSDPVHRVEEVGPHAVGTAVPGHDRQHRAALEPLHTDKRPHSRAAGSRPPPSPPRKKSPEKRPRAWETSHD